MDGQQAHAWLSAATERGAELRKASERLQPPRDTLRRVRRKVMREDQLAEVFNGRRGQPDLGHLQRVEPDRLATGGLREGVVLRILDGRS